MFTNEELDRYLTYPPESDAIEKEFESWAKEQEFETLAKFLGITKEIFIEDHYNELLDHYLEKER